MKMLKKTLTKLLTALLLLCLFLPLLPAAAAPAGVQKQWADLVTGVDANGVEVTTRVFGYYADVEGFGQVFVVCDSNTGEETGDAYVPGARVGEKQGKKLVGYERKKDLDWDHPKQVNPVRVTLIAPNIPTDTQYDIEHYRQTGQLVRKTINQFGWPMDKSFARMIPGSDPDYWLILAVAQNPNPFPVRANVQVRINAWRDGYWDWRPISFEGEVPLGPNETKYILLNRGKNGHILTDEYGEWTSSTSWHAGWSEAYYWTQIFGVDDPEYPDMLRSGNKQGFFTSYVTWDGTDPTVLPLIPMRLAFGFYCWGSSKYWRDNSRSFGEGFGRAEHDPTTGEWTISYSYRYSSNEYKPWWWTDAQWQAFLQKQRENAIRALKPLFEKWYPKVPFSDPWWHTYIFANPDTGEYYFYDRGTGRSWGPGKATSSSWSFKVCFDYLKPVPPSQLPPGAKSLQELYGPWYFLANVRYGGWLYRTGGPWSSGVELPAPTLTQYGRRYWWSNENPVQEWNWKAFTDRDRDGDLDVAQIPKGTGIRRRADVNYYDPYWMNILPVLKARPMFVEKYSFVATGGNFGYLKKDTVPGYLLWVSTEQRPVLNVATHPVEVRASWWYEGWRPDGTPARVYRSWLWTPSAGWQFQGESWEKIYRPQSTDLSLWTLTFRYNQVVSGNNPAEFPASWTTRWGNGAPSLYWPGADALRARIKDMAYNVNYVNVDAAIPLFGVPSLASHESKQLAFCERVAGAQFWRVRWRSQSWDDLERQMLNVITANIIQPVLSSQEEAVFNGGGRFVMTPTFETGKGGIVGGAQKYLVGNRYRYYSRYEMWVFDDLQWWKIGFPNADITLCSYVSGSSPTGGLVVLGGDEYLGDVLWRRSAEIPFDRYVPAGQRYWRLYDGGIYPPPYPED